MYGLKHSQLIKKKENTGKRIYLNFESINKKIKERLNAQLSQKNSGITFDQWLILCQIAENQGINQKKVAESLFKEVSSVSRILQKLQTKSLVTKQMNADNIREYKLYLSPQGYDLVNGLDKELNSVFESIFNSTHEKELNLIIDIVERIKTDLK